MFPEPNSQSLEGKVGMVVWRGGAKLWGQKQCQPSVNAEGSGNDHLGQWSLDLPIHQNTDPNPEPLIQQGWAGAQNWHF